MSHGNNGKGRARGLHCEAKIGMFLGQRGGRGRGLLVKNCKLRLQLFFVDLLRFGKLGVASDLRGVRTEVYYDA